MKILSLAIDAVLRNKDSRAFMRQEAYFKSHEVDIINFSLGESALTQSGSLRVFTTGGSNRVVALIKAIGIMRRELTMSSYNLILSQDANFLGLIGFLIGKFFSVPLVAQLHGDYLDNPLWIDVAFENRVMNIVGKWITRHADGVRVVSERIRRYVVDTLGVDSSRVESLPIGSELGVFSPEGSKTFEGRCFLFVGRLIDEKSPMLFCEAARNALKAIPDLTAVIIGDGDRRDVMQKFFEQEGLADRVKFTGSLDALSLAAWYRSARCLLHSALWEGWGMPMIESLACGCPVVTTDTGCAGEAVIHERNGLVSMSNTAQELGEQTIRICNDDVLYQKLSENARIDAQDWSFDALSQKIISFYERNARIKKD